MSDSFLKKFYLYRNIFNLIEILLFPSYCKICSSFLQCSDEKIVCNECWNKIFPIHEQICIRCGKIMKSSLPSHLCQSCLTEPPPYSLHRSCGKYEGVLKDIILLFKFNGKKVLGEKLAYFAYRVLKANKKLLNSEIIIPVPLHPKREKERGFNQSEILGYELARLTNKKFIKNVLIKIKNTPPQSILDFKERRKNVKGVFLVKNNSFIYKKNILLIDDVYTSGFTIIECSKVLKKAGAKEIFAFTLAQAI